MSASISATEQHSTRNDSPYLRESLRRIHDLPTELTRLLRQIPRGMVTTYGALGRALGDVGAARWVGEFLVGHDHGVDCPCHRVVKADGQVGLFISGQPADKLRRLRDEGVRVHKDRVDLDESLYANFDGPAPLQQLRDLQLAMASHVRLTPLETQPRTIAGVDVSYGKGEQATAAYVEIGLPDLQTTWSTTVTLPVRFPYIPGYLSFRELPILLALFDEVQSQGRCADLTFVDGNGILHPRRTGIATLYGLAIDSPTIGIGKKLLCGQVDIQQVVVNGPQPVIHGDSVLGVAMKGASHCRAIYVSPGHRIDLPGAQELTGRALAGHRLPVPIARADRLSRDRSRQ